MRLTAAQRRALPAAAFGDPKRRLLPVPLERYYAPAKGRLAMMRDRGEYTPAQARAIAERIDDIAATLRTQPDRFARYLRETNPAPSAAARAAKELDRRAVATARGDVDAVRKERKRALARVTAQVAEARRRITEQGRRWRQKAAQQIRDELAAERRAVKEASTERRRKIRDTYRDKLRRAEKMLDEERRYRREIQRAEQRARTRHAKLRKTSAESRRESDDAVRANLPADLVPVFDRVRGRIKGSARRTRTEAFLEWVEAHPDEVAADRAAAADEDVARMIAEHEAELAGQRYANPAPEPASRIDAAKRAYKAFHWNRSASQVRTAEFPDPRQGGAAPYCLGVITEIVYLTDKGEYVKTEFEHKMRRPPRLYYGDGGLLVEGPVRVTSRGIEQ